jgi:tyrosine-protein phosphatase SIW14
MMRKSQIVAGLFVAFGFLGCGSGHGQSSASTTQGDDSPIANFAQVNAGVYRGAHPDASGLAYLQSIGVKTIVDLEIADYIEATPDQIQQEEDTATSMGFSFVREPMSAFQPFVSDDEMNATMQILADPSQQPAYVHCLHGQDRTGLVIGLERVIDEGWAPADAYAEMLANGFHPEFLGLKHYFDEKTGYDDD